MFSAFLTAVLIVGTMTVSVEAYEQKTADIDSLYD